MREDINVDTSAELSYLQYAQPEFEIPAQQVITGTVITNISGLTGPTITFSGGSSGFDFIPSGTIISLLSPLTTKGDILVRNSTEGTRLAVGSNYGTVTADSAQSTGLRYTKNNIAVVPPAVTDDLMAGYNYFSQWIDSTGPDIYACLNPANGAAVWKKLSP